MHKRTPFRRIVALVIATALAMTQLALSAYACPSALGLAAAAPHEQADCHRGAPESDPGRVPLCVKTCQDEPQKCDAPALAVLPQPSGEGLRLEPMPDRLLRVAMHADAGLRRPSAPPPNLLFARFLK